MIASIMCGPFFTVYGVDMFIHLRGGSSSAAASGCNESARAPPAGHIPLHETFTFLAFYHGKHIFNRIYHIFINLQ